MELEDVPLEVVTVTSTVPAASAGDTAVHEVELEQETPVAATPPKLTVLSGVKPVPEMVTEVPPPRGPLEGATRVTVGAEAATDRGGMKKSNAMAISEVRSNAVRVRVMLL